MSDIPAAVSRRTRYLICVAAACLGTLGALAGAAQATSGSSPAAVVAVVTRSDLAVRRGFAELALQTLVAEYREELVLASRDASGSWRAGTAGFATGLERALARVAIAADIEVAQEAHGTVRLGIDGEQILLSVPRPARQAGFDRALFERFCRAWQCPEPPSAHTATRDLRGARVTTAWLFSDRGPPVLAAPDGLACVFDDTRDLQRKRRACERIMDELRRTADTLRAVTDSGQGLDWAVVRLAPEPATGLSRLIHDAQGSFHHVDLPGLTLFPEVLRDALPWLQARLRGHVGYSMIKTLERHAYLE
jgi:hypothetical protein